MIVVARTKSLILIVTFTLSFISWVSSFFGWIPHDVSRVIGLSGALFGTIFIGHSALKTLFQGEFGIDLLATVAILASIWVGEYLAAAIVALMLGGGEVLEGVCV